MTDKSTDRLCVTIEEATRLLSVGRSSIYNEIKAGRLRALKLGRRTVIATTELRRYLDGLPATGDAA